MARKTEMPEDVRRMTAEMRKAHDNPDPHKHQVGRRNPNAVSAAEMKAQLRTIRDQRNGQGNPDRIAEGVVQVARAPSDTFIAGYQAGEQLYGSLNEKGVKGFVKSIADNPDITENPDAMAAFIAATTAVPGMKAAKTYGLNGLDRVLSASKMRPGFVVIGENRIRDFAKKLQENPGLAADIPSGIPRPDIKQYRKLVNRRSFKDIPADELEQIRIRTGITMSPEYGDPIYEVPVMLDVNDSVVSAAREFTEPVEVEALKRDLPGMLRRWDEYNGVTGAGSKLDRFLSYDPDTIRARVETSRKYANDPKMPADVRERHRWTSEHSKFLLDYADELEFRNEFAPGEVGGPMRPRALERLAEGPGSRLLFAAYPEWRFTKLRVQPNTGVGGFEMPSVQGTHDLVVLDRNVAASRDPAVRNDILSHEYTHAARSEALAELDDLDTIAKETVNMNKDYAGYRNSRHEKEAFRYGERANLSPTEVMQTPPIRSGVYRQAAKGGDAPGESRSSGIPSGHNAALDGYQGPKIMINPSTFRNEKDALCVAWNEALRVAMEAMDYRPQAKPTEAQRRFFADTPYADDELQLRRTILARICVFDTSIS